MNNLLKIMSDEQKFFLIEELDSKEIPSEEMTWCIEPQGIMNCSIEQFFSNTSFEEILEFSKQLIQNGLGDARVSFVIITGDLEKAPEHFRPKFRKTKSLTRPYFFILE